ncbi:M48 family metallopeptidase [Plantactinospora soyae]|uniref:Zn-dependent protease with chaperone function n=1 Tax=Plantactinospora soyae TaxID=1544732 RepID=A0A927MI26_9ACTN|nr:M48 family metallopeptidase [Plantactinospora soyae]MBE1492053.1 Zn-dependent protease with chaperone function [Plantactinospora soyae]
MIATVRAGLAVAMLAGFYLLALVQLVAVFGLGAWLASLIPGLLALKLIWPLLVAASGTVGLALWRAIRSRPEPPEGLPVTPAQAPMLWNAVRALATEVGTRPPDEIRLVPIVNAAVVEQSRLLGLMSGRRHLYLGIPLLYGLSLAQFYAVLAHELGHYSGRHTTLGAVAYRGRLAIGGTIGRIGRYNPIGWGFKGYARLYLLVDHAVVRRQELEADRAAVRVAGRQAAGDALRELHVIDAAWDFYFSRYVGPAWESGHTPEDLFGGFRHLLAGRQSELARLRQETPDDQPSRWDTHPPLTERLAAIAGAPARNVAVDDRPAALLLPELDLLGRELQAALVDTDGRTVLSWPELTAITAGAATERAAARVGTRLAEVVAGTAPPCLGALLDLVEAGRLVELAQPLLPSATRREVAEKFAPMLVPLLTLAAQRSGVVQWRHSWSGPPELLGVRDGRPLDLAELARLAVVPETTARARHWLAALGVDLGAALVATRAAGSPAGPAAGTSHAAPPADEVLGGFAHLKVNNVPHDVLVLGSGLILVANPDQSETGKERLTRLIDSMPVAELAQRHQFVPYAEIGRAQILKSIPLRAELTLSDGRQLSLAAGWTTPLLTKESDSVLIRLLGSESSGRLPGPSAAGGRAPAAGPGGGGPGGPARLASGGGGADGARVLDGLANVKVDNAQYDLLILDVGLVLIGDPGPFQHGRERLLTLIRRWPVEEIADRNWLIRYEEIMRARVNRSIPVRAELELGTGHRITITEPWTTQTLTDQGGQVLVHALRSVGAEVVG